jgi:hypothetical protein
MNNKVNKLDLPMVISQEIDKNKIVYLPKIPQKTLLREEESFYNGKREKQNIGNRVSLVTTLKAKLCEEESFYNGKREKQNVGCREESFYNDKREKQNVGCREESFYNGKEKPLIIHPHIPCNPKRSF